ncbi:MAG: HEAT repeat domain-containing protein [Kofleriaceae bacterium]|nr:HEAT repeat domain-containing protein [Myxococcales bacterium]MCB9565234.1 HEAT repeat domain-containing protein [Kofleriaceae bacterium]MCB9572403.1 HEAT repeat domain-containing protein [Kofleriaceae bacterium]
MVFGLFSKEKALQRTIDRATNKLSQQADRWGALEKLREDGSEEALYGLCKRFSIVCMKGSEDEVEKRWTVEVLVAKGDQALAPLRRYLKNHAQLGFALEVLGQIVPHDRALEVADEVLATEEPGYTRDPERRLDVIKWLGEWKDSTPDDVVPRLVPYLKDHSEDVRYFSAEGIARHWRDDAGEHLIAALINPEEEAGRFKRRLCEILIEHDQPLGDLAAQVSAAMTGPATDGFAVKNGKLVAR